MGIARCKHAYTFCTASQSTLVSFTSHILKQRTTTMADKMRKTYANFNGFFVCCCCWPFCNLYNHIFTLYDISTFVFFVFFQLCNFIKRAIVFVRRFLTTNQFQRNEKPTGTFENATHIPSVLLNRQSSCVWVFRISMFYLYAHFTTSLANRIEDTAFTQ